MATCMRGAGGRAWEEQVSDGLKHVEAVRGAVRGRSGEGAGEEERGGKGRSDRNREGNCISTERKVGGGRKEEERGRGC